MPTTTIEKPVKRSAPKAPAKSDGLTKVLRRMLTVDPDQAKHYRQRTGE